MESERHFPQRDDIVGKGIHPAAERSIQNEYTREHTEALQLLPGEQEKSAEVLQYIALINTALHKRCAILGIQDISAVLPEQFHLFHETEYAQHFPKQAEVVQAFQTKDSSSVSINQDHFSSAGLLAVLMHEALHLLSRKKVIADVDDEQKRISVTSYRSGYNTVSPKVHQNIGTDLFRGLNEAVVEKMAQELIRPIMDQLCFTAENRVHAVGYSGEIAIIEGILGRVALQKHENVEQTWLRWQRGLFSGEMMHLRDIEHVYGKGAVRVLAAMDASYMEDSEHSADLYRLAKRYFTEDDPQERQRIVEQLQSVE